MYNISKADYDIAGTDKRMYARGKERLPQAGSPGIGMKQAGNRKIDERTSMFVLAGPIFAEMLLNILLNNVDTMMISRYSNDAVGAIGNANQMMNLFIIMFGVIASATGVVVSQYLGADKKDNMNQIFSLAIGVNLAFGIFMSAIMFLFCRNFLQLLNVKPLQFDDAVTYTRMVGGLLFLQAGYNVMVQILRCHGYTKVGMVISLIVNLINIVGNYIFLYGPLKFLKLGVAGVAICTVTARIVALAVAIAIFYRYKIGKISLKYLKPFPGAMLLRMLRIGVPSAGENVAYSFYQLILMSFVNDMGTAATNAKVYASTLMMFSVVFSNSMAQATMIVTGHLIGAGKEKEADRRVMKTLVTVLPVAICLAGANCLLSPLTLRLFTDSGEVIGLVQRILAVGIVMEIGRTTNLVIIGSMKASGDVLFPVLIGMLSMWGVGLSVGYMCGVVLVFGVAGIFMGTAADECFRGIIVLIRWRMGKWKGKAVVRAS